MTNVDFEVYRFWGSSSQNHSSIAQNLVSDDEHRAAVVMHDNFNGITVGVQEIGAAADDWELYNFAGADLAEFTPPFENDTHNYPRLFLDGRKHLHLVANLHSDVLRYRRTTQPITAGITSWEAGHLPNWSDGPLWQGTYPQHTMLRHDKSLFFTSRVGPSPEQSGRGNWWYWHKSASAAEFPLPVLWMQGVGAPYDSAATDTANNFNAYPSDVCYMRVNGEDRYYYTVNWRIIATDDHINSWQGVFYHDENLNWFAWDGTPLTLPITKDTLSIRIPDAIRKDGSIGEPIYNGGGVGVTPDGQIVVAQSLDPHHIYHYIPGLGWFAPFTLDTSHSSGWISSGRVVPRYVPQWGAMGYTAMGIKAFTKTEHVAPMLFSITQTRRPVRLGGRTPARSEPNPDAWALSERGVFEVNCPVNNRPRVYSWGAGPRVVAP